MQLSGLGFVSHCVTVNRMDDYCSRSGCGYRYNNAMRTESVYDSCFFDGAIARLTREGAFFRWQSWSCLENSESYLQI